VESADGKTLGDSEGALWGGADVDSGAARRVDRDVKAVHGDITALLAAGILDRTTDGEIEFPFDAVKVEFLLQAA
jgi:predicted transcriptional regulator